MDRLWLRIWVLATVLAVAVFAADRHAICGIVHQVNGAKFALETRDGKTVHVDASAAVKAERTVPLHEGLAVSAEGTLDKKGVLQAEIVNRVKPARAMWPPDR